MLSRSRIQAVACCLVLTGVLSLVLPRMAGAVAVDGLYEGSARVVDSGEAARQKAYADALAMVLTKLSGRRDAPARAAAALKDAG